MSESKHTPGMLQYEVGYRDPDVLTENGDLFAAVYTDETAEADAARIVLTWNCHDDLLAALRDMQSHWHHMIGLASPKTFHDINARAEAAIAKAEGRS